MATADLNSNDSVIDPPEILGHKMRLASARCGAAFEQAKAIMIAAFWEQFDGATADTVGSSISFLKNKQEDPLQPGLSDWNHRQCCMHELMWCFLDAAEHQKAVIHNIALLVHDLHLMGYNLRWGLALRSKDHPGQTISHDVCGGAGGGIGQHDGIIKYILMSLDRDPLDPAARKALNQRSGGYTRDRW